MEAGRQLSGPGEGNNQEPEPVFTYPVESGENDEGGELQPGPMVVEADYKLAEKRDYSKIARDIREHWQRDSEKMGAEEAAHKREKEAAAAAEAALSRRDKLSKLLHRGAAAARRGAAAARRGAAAAGNLVGEVLRGPGDGFRLAGGSGKHKTKKRKSNRKLTKKRKSIKRKSNRKLTKKRKSIKRK